MNTPKWNFRRSTSHFVQVNSFEKKCEKFEKNFEKISENYKKLIDQIPELQRKGISAAIYTQTTDVEGEVNGLMTYDRAILKMNAEKMKEVNAVLFDARIFKKATTKN